MQEAYYLNKLYPFQDEILNWINSLDVGFYLSGGTALSRCFLKHRYSDDLDFFGKVDNWRNILSNKLCALSRMEPKDYADILFISQKYNFNWEEIIQEAKKKDLWVEPIKISKMIREFPVKLLKPIKWITPPDLKQATYFFSIISKDILKGLNNSIVPDN